MQLPLAIANVATVAFALFAALVVMSTVVMSTTDDGGKSDSRNSGGAQSDGGKSVGTSVGGTSNDGTSVTTMSGAETDIGISDIASITNSFAGVSDAGPSESRKAVSGSPGDAVSVGKSTATSDPTTREKRRSTRIRIALSYARALSGLRVRRSADTRGTRYRRGHMRGSQGNSMAHNRNSAQATKTTINRYKTPGPPGMYYDGQCLTDGTCKCAGPPTICVNVVNHVSQSQAQEQTQAQKQAQAQGQKGYQRHQIGEWSRWGDWTKCSRTCTRYRYRTCSTHECIGSNELHEPCDTEDCRKLVECEPCPKCKSGQYGGLGQSREPKKPTEALNQYNLLDATSKPTEPVETEVTECYTPGRRGSYTGHLSTTKNKKTCQRWDSQTPHRHKQKPTLFIGDNDKYPENYCRVVDIARPWCYTTEPGIRFDFCDIPMCELFILNITTTMIKKGSRTAVAHLNCILYYANGKQQEQQLGTADTPIMLDTSLVIEIPPQYSGIVSNFSVILPENGINYDEWKGSATLMIERQRQKIQCNGEIDLRPGRMHYQVCMDTDV